MVNHQQIVGNKEVGHAQLFLKVLKHIDDLGLNGNVQRGNRLVTDDKLGVHRQSAGNADALALAAGKLMGIAHGVLGVEADQLHQLHDAVAALLGIFAEFVDIQGLADDILHRHTGVQRGIRVLEHHLHLLAVGQHIDADLFAQNRLAVGAHLETAILVILLAAVIQHVAVKGNAAAGGLVKLKKGAAHGGFAAAGLAHQTQGLPGTDGEGDVVHRLEGDGLAKPGTDGEIFFQVLDLNQIFAVCHLISPPSHFSRSSSRTHGGYR